MKPMPGSNMLIRIIYKWARSHRGKKLSTRLNIITNKIKNNINNDSKTLLL